MAILENSQKIIKRSQGIFNLKHVIIIENYLVLPYSVSLYKLTELQDFINSIDKNICFIVTVHNGYLAILFNFNLPKQ